MSTTVGPPRGTESSNPFLSSGESVSRGTLSSWARTSVAEALSCARVAKSLLGQYEWESLGTSPVDKETFAFGSFNLVPPQRMLLEDGKPLRLGSRALDILITPVESAGETIGKDQLIARTWPDTVVDEGALRVHVAALRKALGDGQAGKRYIANIPGRGYSFIAPVTREQRQPAVAPTNGTAVRGNLPAPLTRIVGRDDIIATLAAQLAQRRFLTIVGPGGIGKTTVALAVAEKMSASYEDGGWFVGLASLPDPDLVTSALGTVLGVSLPGTNPISGLAGWLRNKRALIVLDSCEHVIGAVAAIAEAILKAAVRVSILATSREPLRAEGEWLHRLPSLELPPRSDDLTPEGALQYSAVQLFNERARAIMDGFALDATISLRSSRFVTGWTGCRLRSNWQRRASMCSVSRDSPRGSTIASPF